MTEKYRSRVERKQTTTHSSKKKKKTKKGASAFFKQLILIMFILGIIGIVSGAATFFILVQGAPTLDTALFKDPLSSKIYDMNGNEIADWGAEQRTYVSYSEIPPVLRDAVIATEDSRFFEHNGIDIIRLGGAVIANVTDGFGAEGASTITQQVVKNYFLSPEKTIKRKVQEAWLAFQLDSQYKKEEILEIYLNKIYYSNGDFGGKPIYGVAEAAEVYFGIDNLDQLSLEQAALIAGIPQRPNAYNPFKHPEAAEKRRNIVLMLMVQHGKITQEEADAAKAVSISDMLAPTNNNTTQYGAFLDQVIEEVTELGDVDISTDGLKIYTTIDPKAQSYVDKMLTENGKITYPNEEMQAGIALIDTKTGEIRALGGGRNNENVQRGWNYATDTRKQPGSTIKPILDYGPAIEFLQWSTYEQVVDEPYTYSDKNNTPIHNWDRKYEGQMSIRTALARSRNIPALKAMQAVANEVGTDKVQQFANNLGLPLDKVHEAYSIGGLTEGVSPLQMAGAYSAFGNSGIYVKPHAVTKVVFQNGTEVTLKPEPIKAMRDYTAFMITDMLRSVLTSPIGTGRAAQVPGLDIAGKTGTTNFPAEIQDKYDLPNAAVPDSWFVGYTTDYTLSVWTGFDKFDQDNYLLGSEQTGISKLLFRSIMEYISDGKDNKPFQAPNSVEKLAVENGTNPAKLVSEFTPEDKVIYEYFVKGTEPTEVSTNYIKIEPVTNASAEYDEILDAIGLTWEYITPNTVEEPADYTFEVMMSIDEGAPTLLSSQKDSTVLVENPIKGAIYTFNIIAMNTNNPENKSEPISVSITVPEFLNPIELPPIDSVEPIEPGDPENPIDEPIDENEDEEELPSTPSTDEDNIGDTPPADNQGEDNSSSDGN
ncbi:PBP1A family penicillin-binding protein [Bacillus sp. HMF5848]|uniref:transglycosylase domain-containing protein n=1 Tax=Bacillus sp. HMF5848 TaxID=2495421 RepID=UPI000F7A4961|nr:transglycosylase domain-containing protein [Bacillus sp. HMF5848]RSK27393.1 PBP1A family penicillin-binding protein [Bacillus sp. HMF5848]